MMDKAFHHLRGGEDWRLWAGRISLPPEESAWREVTRWLVAKWRGFVNKGGW